MARPDTRRMEREPLSPHRKALRINLDAKVYGTFAEIGGGQEVARWFFHVGGAAGTVAKTISAYDMAVSDALYGRSHRYVSRQRLQAMLDSEYTQLIERLGASRGAENAFFVLADTVATRSYSHRKDGDGWMGVRFQTAPGAEPSEIIVHVSTLDRERVREQEALGLVGVNLLYGAVYHHHEPAVLLASLMDNVSRQRIDIDLIKFSGAAFADVDNRLMNLQLVERGFTDAVMFAADGEVVQPAEVLYRQSILVERGRFRPVTRLNVNMLECAAAQMREEAAAPGHDPRVFMEMTLRDLAAEEGIDHADFLARVEILRALDTSVLISNYDRYFQLGEYLARYTQEQIGIALGVPSLQKIAQAHFYTDLEGGVLEFLGRLFKNNVRLFVYPYRHPETGAIVAVESSPVQPQFQHLYRYLLENSFLRPIRNYDAACLGITADDVLARMRAGDPAWEEMVPPGVAATIKRERLFGWQG
jgi:hypothetical protein